jgi:hypothetical protein
MQAAMRAVCALGLGLLGLLSGCQRLLSIEDPVAGEPPVHDAASDAGCPIMRSGSPLLLSEVVLTPDAGEMIEIVNTSTDDVDLTTYYLSDSGNYYRMPLDKTVDATDFIVKFPDGAHIPGHTAFTIALAATASFTTTYGVAPTFSLKDTGTTTLMMTSIAMIGMPQLTNPGEPIILFQWDGQSDLVRDVDILIAGAPATNNALPSKSGVLQDGPDADAQMSQYAADAGSMRTQGPAPGVGQSIKRILLEDCHETQSGTGNGVDGHDETSEDTTATWDGATANPFTPPTPGKAPQELMR